jgi:Ca2+-binding RTX toxin-like protein
VGTKAHDADDRIIYNKATGALYYDDDGTGAHVQVQFATLGATIHPTNLAYNDFVLI